MTLRKFLTILRTYTCWLGRVEIREGEQEEVTYQRFHNRKTTMMILPRLYFSIEIPPAIKYYQAIEPNKALKGVWDGIYICLFIS